MIADHQIPVSLKFQFNENGLGANLIKCTITKIVLGPFYCQEMSLKLAGEPFYYKEMSLSVGNVHLKLLVNRNFSKPISDLADNYR